MYYVAIFYLLVHVIKQSISMYENVIRLKKCSNNMKHLIDERLMNNFEDVIVDSYPNMDFIMM